MNILIPQNGHHFYQIHRAMCRGCKKKPACLLEPLDQFVDRFVNRLLVKRGVSEAETAPALLPVLPDQPDLAPVASAALVAVQELDDALGRGPGAAAAAPPAAGEAAKHLQTASIFGHLFLASFCCIFFTIFVQKSRKISQKNK